MKLLDIHAHLHDEAFDRDRDDVISKMEEEEIGAITVGTDFLNSRKALDLAEKHKFIWATVGEHPTDHFKENFNQNEYKNLLKSPKVVGVGECGLDYFRNPDLSEKERQKDLFLKHVDLALEFEKPLMIHCRPSKGVYDAHQEMLSILKELKVSNTKLSGVIHFFTGSSEIASQYLELGFFVSISGVITFAPELEEMVMTLKEDSFFVESDAPYASPKPFRGKRNDPTFTAHTLKYVAKLKGLDEGNVALKIIKNAEKLFKTKVF